MVDEMLHGGLLEPIDLRKDVRQRRGVRRAEVPAARRVGDLAEQLLVDLYRHRLVAKAQWALPRRDRCLALSPDADRIDLDAERRGGLSRGARIHRPLVVLTIGKQHDDLALAGSAAQAVRAGGDCGSNGRPVFEDTDAQLTD